MKINGKKEKAGRRTGWGRVGTVAAAAILALPTAGAAQGHDDGHGGFWTRPHGEFFLYGEAALSAGGLHSYADLGGGLGAGGTLFLDRMRNAALRVEGRLSAYEGGFNHPPHTTTGLRGMRVGTDITIISVGIGPQVYLRTGSVRPYVYGTLGFARLVGDTNARGYMDDEPVSRSVDLDGTGAALSAGGGISVQVRGGDRPVAVDVSASYQHHGIADHLDRRHAAQEHGPPSADGFGVEPPPYDLVQRDHHHGGQAGGDHHHGDRIVFPHMVSDFNFVTWRIGVNFGLF